MSMNPYRDAALNYLESGWNGVLPLPPEAKWPPATGYTGRGNPDPDPLTIREWLFNHNGNIALRLPDNVIGIDVDAYGTKEGGKTLQLLELELGFLPSTWRITSRDDGTSGIRLYRAPVGLKWPSIFGKDIECIRREHRYAVAPPSQHPNGGTYRWINPTGLDHVGTPPRPDDLPELPAIWVTHFTHNRTDTTTSTEHITPEQHNQLAAAINTDGNPCAQIKELMLEFETIMDGGKGSRHDACLGFTLKLVSLGARGHKGVKQTIDACEHIFTQIIGLDRGTEAARTEWRNLIKGAIDRNPAIDPEPCTGDTCTNDLARYLIDLPAPHDIAPDIDDKATWDPIDLHDIYTGQREPEQPTCLQRADGHFLLYPGKVHSIYGEPESGKSLIAQWETAIQLAYGNPVLYIDCESDEYTIIERLKRMGVTLEQLQNLTYIRPERSWKASLAEHEAWKNVIDRHYTLAVIDGVTEALTMFGFETNDNDGITKFMRLIPRQIARHTKAATVLIDHIAKNSSSRFAIGGQAKLAAIDGAAYLIDIITPIAIGTTGQLKMSITKDRPGRIRSHCIIEKDRSSRIQTAAYININSTGEDTIIDIATPDPEHAAKKADKELRDKMRQFSLDIGKTFGKERFSGADVDKQIPGDNNTNRRLLDELVKKGVVTKDTNYKKLYVQTGYYNAQPEDNT